MNAVLHLSTSREWRGGERQLLLLAAGLAARCSTVWVAAPNGSPLAERTRAAGLPLLALRARPVLHPANLVDLVRWQRRHPGAILHSHTSPALTLGSLSRRFTGGRLVHTRRVAFPVRHSRKYRAVADRYVAVSQAVAAALVEAGLDRRRLDVIRSAVDLALLESVTPTPELDASRSAIRVCCVAQMTAEKGHANLLAAWAEVARRWPDACLVLVGDGPLRPRLEAAAAGLSRGAVVFAGFRPDVAAWLRACGVYVQPSLSEGLGTSVLDAMGCRLPVVASETGGLPEAVVDGETGLLVPPGDPGALAAALLDLLERPERAAAMGAAGHRRAEAQFSVGRMVDEYVELYARLA